MMHFYSFKPTKEKKIEGVIRFERLKRHAFQGLVPHKIVNCDKRLILLSHGLSGCDVRTHCSSFTFEGKSTLAKCKILLEETGILNRKTGGGRVQSTINAMNVKTNRKLLKAITESLIRTGSNFETCYKWSSTCKTGK